MGVRIDIDKRVVDWLASMGYPVGGMPPQMLQGMLIREARQWQLSPGALKAMIIEGARTPLTLVRSASDGRAQAAPAEEGTLRRAANAPHAAIDRRVSMHH